MLSAKRLGRQNDLTVIDMRRTKESGIPTYVQNLEVGHLWGYPLFWQRECFDQNASTWMRRMLGLFFLIQASTSIYTIVKAVRFHSVGDAVLAIAIVVAIQFAGWVYCFLDECFHVQP